MELSISSLLNAYREVGLVLVLLLLGLLYFRKDKRGQRYPPGPSFGLPLFGHLLQLGERPHLTLQKWKHKYGPVIMFKMGFQNAVVVSDGKLMKELLSTAVTTGKPQSEFFNELTHGRHGILTSDGRTWEEQRAFTVRTLKTLGMSKQGGNHLEGIILEEAKALLEYFGKRLDSPIQVRRVFNGPVVSSLWSIVSGERAWDVDGVNSPIFEQAGELMANINEAMKTALPFVSWLRHVSPKDLGWSRYVKAVRGFLSLADETVTRHETILDKNCASDFIDHHLIRTEDTNDPTSSFYKETGRNNIKGLVADLFLAGSETTSSSLEFAMLCCSQHAQIQNALQAEIDNVVGLSRLPALSDRKLMPYTEAVIMEVLRMSGAVTRAGRRLLADCEFQGYLLPKNSLLFGDIYNVHRDTSVWGQDAEVFRPERFLSQDGRQVVHHEAFVPFGAGRRMCVGELLAKDTLFLFLTCIFQRFEVRMFPEGKKADYNDLEPGAFLLPKPFEISVSLRSN